MVDLILAASFVAVYAGGFWCGAKFKTCKAMVEAALQKLKE